MRFCTSCGAQLKDDSLFCTRCGAKMAADPNVVNAQNAQAAQNRQANPQPDPQQYQNRQANPQPDPQQTQYRQANPQQNAQQAQYRQPDPRQYSNQGGANYGYRAPGRDPYQALRRPVIDRGLTAILGYLGWLSFLIAMVGGDRKDRYARVHLNHALWIHIVTTAGIILFNVGLALTAVGAVYRAYGAGSARYAFGIIFILISVAGIIFSFVCFLVGLIRACKGNAKPLPLYGQLRILK